MKDASKATMIRAAGAETQAEQALAETAERMLEGIRSEPVPEAITQLAHRLQDALEARRENVRRVAEPSTDAQTPEH